MQIVWVVIGVLDLGVRFDPVDPLAVLAPKPNRIRDGLVVHFLVAVIIYKRIRCDRSRYGK